MNETLREVLPIMGMFFGLLSIIKFYASRIERKIDKIESEIDKIIKKLE